MEPASETLELGVFGRPHGIQGAVSFWPHNARSVALATIKRGVRLASDGVRHPVRILSARPSGKSWVVTLHGAARREDVEALVGQPLFVDPALLPAIEDDDEFYYHEVIGASVETASGEPIGVVSDVFETSTDVLSVKRTAGGILDVPVVGAYVVRIDRVGRRVIVVDDVVSLLSLDEGT